MLGARKRGHARRRCDVSPGAGLGAAAFPTLRDAIGAQRGRGGVVISPGKRCWPRVERLDALSVARGLRRTKEMEMVITSLWQDHKMLVFPVWGFGLP